MIYFTQLSKGGPLSMVMMSCAGYAARRENRSVRCLERVMALDEASLK